MTRLGVIILAVVAIVAGGLGGLVALSSSDESPGSDASLVLGGPLRYRGVRQFPAYPLPAVRLKTATGASFDFAANSEGKLLLLYVGYTNCADACPLQMATISQALQQLSSADAGRVLVVFVTADPERDTPEVLDKWLANFDARFVGLRGEQAEVNALQRSLGLNPASHASNDHGSYDVDHGTTVFAFPPESRQAELVYPMGTTAADYASDIAKLLKDGRVGP